jgi:hypothetical protein
MNGHGPHLKFTSYLPLLDASVGSITAFPQYCCPSLSAPVVQDARALSVDKPASAVLSMHIRDTIDRGNDMCMTIKDEHLDYPLRSNG